MTLQEETDLPVAVMLLGNKSDVTAKDARQVSMILPVFS